MPFAMPLWLIKYLPYGLAAAALIGAVWYINHAGYERAKEQDKVAGLKIDNAMAKLNADLTKKVDDVQNNMQTQMDNSSTVLASKLDNIDQVSKTIIQPTITKEIASAPRFTDPADGITNGMFNALNQARALSTSPCPAGASNAGCVTVPSGTATP